MGHVPSVSYHAVLDFQSVKTVLIMGTGDMQIELRNYGFNGFEILGRPNDSTLSI